MLNILLQATGELTTADLTGASANSDGFNFAALGILALIVVVVGVIMYFLHKHSKQSERAGKSGAGANPIVQFIVVVLFVIIVSALGFLRHGILGFIVVFAVFSAILALIFLSIKNRQRHFELTQANPATRLVVGAVSAILAIGLPILILINSKMFDLNAGTILISVAGVLVFIALIVAALILGNRKNTASVALGYLFAILAAVLPGIMIVAASIESSALAMAYLAALIAAIFAYFSINQFIQID
ncbi:MAG: hypothetical protein WCY21_05605 [Candidatus Cloacimonadaceae bacterium]|jgi:protein-S-isoprenylcysteine O-methyltransferase Ste14|nr:hypothetical protein [Candidatus Cloacimonadota bacterium]MDX9949960.1 hypothetical protein [Candidatus Syntrophosphaera sp.]NLN85537.1 hypothetical protein [Candidatus Cloacimonadota bacterium]